MISGIGSTTTALVGARTATGTATARATAAKAGSGALNTSARIVAEGAPVELDRVAALRSAIRAGSYRADPAAIAGRMIDGDLG